MKGEGKIICEVAWAEPEQQYLIEVMLHPGATAVDAFEASGLRAKVASVADVPADALRLGVFGEYLKAPANYCVRQGDRIEVYRPLQIDPRQARRARAQRRQ